MVRESHPAAFRHRFDLVEAIAVERGKLVDSRFPGLGGEVKHLTRVAMRNRQLPAGELGREAQHDRAEKVLCVDRGVLVRFEKVAFPCK